MADNFDTNAASGGVTFASDDITGVHYPIIKLGIGALDSVTLLSGNSGTKDGGTVRVVLATDQPQLTNALKVDGSAVTQPVSIAATVTVDASGTTVPVDSELTTADLDTGAGTDTRAVVGLVLAESGGGLLVGSAHPIPISDNSGSLTVDNGGTFAVQAAQSGTWNITNVSGTVSLPTGAATAAKQPALGTAGTASADVITVQGIASMTALKVDGSAVTQPVSDGGSTISIDDGAGNISVDWAGTVPPIGAGTEAAALRVTVATDSTGVLSVDDNGSSLTVDNGGTFATQATLQTGTNSIGKISDITTSVVPGTGATNLGKAEDAAHSSGDVGVMMLGVRAASPTDRSTGPTDGDYEPLGLNEVGAVWTSLTPSVNGGLSTFMASGSDGSSILVATAQVVKASAGALYGYYAYNPEAAVTFVHFYNTAAASVTVGTTNPLMTIAIPAASAANLSIPQGITFSNAGWSVAATTTAGGNTAPATGVSLVAWYK